MRSPRHAANEVAWLDADGNVGANVPCLSCHASLRGRPLSGACACGREVFETIRDVLPAIDHTGHIADDLPCGRCGYNLRTLFLMDACPECAAPVARAARSNLLPYADPAWVQRLALGASKVFRGYYGVCVVPAVGGPAALAIASLVDAVRGHDVDGFVFRWIFAPIVILIAILLLLSAFAGSWGLLELSAPEPGRDQSGRWTARRFARLSAWAPAMFVVVGAVQLLLVPLGSPAALLAVFALLLLGLAVAVLSYARELAARIPDGDLEGNIRQMRRCVVISWLCLCVLLPVSTMLEQSIPAASPAFVLIALAAGVLGAMLALLMLILGFGVLANLRDRLAAAAKQAQANRLW